MALSSGKLELNGHHYKVCTYLDCMNEKSLRRLGEALGLTYTKLEKMKELPEDMVAAWLRGEDKVGCPTWSILVEKLKEIGQTRIATNIEAEQILFNSQPGSGAAFVNRASHVTIVCPYAYDSTTSGQGINEKLNSKSLSMIKKFNNLCHATSDSLKALSTPLDGIKSLCTQKEMTTSSTQLQVMPDKHLPQLWQQFPKLKNASNVDEIMHFVSNCCSFMTYEMLESVIIGTRQDQLEGQLTQYKEALSKYSQKHSLECRMEISKLSDEDHVEMHVKLTDSYQKCTIKVLISKVKELQAALKYSSIIRLGRLEFTFHQRYVITFQLPFHLLPHILPISSECKESLTALGVEKLWLNQNVEMSTSTENDTMETQKVLFPTIPKDLQEINNMKQKFYGILDKLWTSIKDSDVKRTIARLIETNCVSEHEAEKLKQKTSAEDLRIHLGVKYWSYLDVDNLVPIIDRCSNSDVKTDFNEYMTNLEQLKKQTVSEFPHGFFLQGIAGNGVRTTSITMEEENPSLMHIIRCVKRNLAHILQCLPNQLILHEISSGSIEVTFLMEKSVAEEVFEKKPLSPKQIAALRAEYITSLKYKSCNLLSIKGKEDKDSGIDTMSTTSETTRDADNILDEDPKHEQVESKLDYDASKLLPPGLSFELHHAAYTGKLGQVKELVKEQELNPLEKDEAGNTALHYAAASGHLKILQYFVDEKNCNPACKGQIGWTPCHVAAQCNKLDIVRYLIEETQMDPLTLDDESFTPLHRACEGGDINVVKYLIDKMREHTLLQDIINEKTTNGNTPLHYAALNGHLSVVKHLVSDLKCEPSVQGWWAQTPLHRAVKNGHLDVAKYLVEEGNCDPAKSSGDELTPLHTAAQYGHLDLVKYLSREAHVDLNCKDSSGETPLHYAANNDKLEVVKFLTSEMNCDPSITDNDGKTALHTASAEGSLSTVKYFVEDLHCDPTTCLDGQQDTPLIHAARKGKLNVVKYLTIDRQCEPLCRSSNRTTPLHEAAKNGHPDVVKFFIEDLKCDPNTPGHRDRTPLIYASQGGNLEVTKYLIEDQKCDPKVKTNTDGVTPLHMAALNGHYKVIEYLVKEKFCSPLSRDNFPFTPIHYAAREGYLDVLKYFIEECKCPANVAGAEGKTPMFLAKKYNHYHLVEYLKSISK